MLRILRQWKKVCQRTIYSMRYSSKKYGKSVEQSAHGKIYIHHIFLNIQSYSASLNPGLDKFATPATDSSQDATESTALLRLPAPAPAT